MTLNPARATKWLKTADAAIVRCEPIFISKFRTIQIQAVIFMTVINPTVFT